MQMHEIKGRAEEELRRNLQVIAPGAVPNFAIDQRQIQTHRGK